MKKIENTEKFTDFLKSFTGTPTDEALDAMPSMTYEDYESSDEATQRTINLAYLNYVMGNNDRPKKPTITFTLQNFFNDESRQNI